MSEIAQRSLERKRRVLTHYGNGECACLFCGFSDIRALSIDHISSNGHKEKCGTTLYRRLISESFPIGDQTLCMNCQWVKRSIKHETARVCSRSRKQKHGRQKILQLRTNHS